MLEMFCCGNIEQGNIKYYYTHPPLSCCRKWFNVLMLSLILIIINVGYIYFVAAVYILPYKNASSGIMYIFPNGNIIIMGLILIIPIMFLISVWILLTKIIDWWTVKIKYLIVKNEKYNEIEMKVV